MTGPRHSTNVGWDLPMDGALEYLSEADRVVTRCVRLEVSHDERDEFAEVLGAVEDWRAVLESAQLHGLKPLFYAVLRRQELLGHVPAEFIGELKASYHNSAAFTTFVSSELARIADAMSRRGVDVMFIKSLPLGQELYHDVAERPFGDVDLVVHEESWAQFREALLELGYQPGHNAVETLPLRLIPQVGLDHSYDFFGPRRLPIECKFDLLELGLTMRGLEGAWLRARHFDMGGFSVTRPSLEDELLTLCVHLNRHGYGRLVWLLDIVLLAKQRDRAVNWRQLVRRARNEGVEPSVYYTFRLAEAVFGFPMPWEIGQFAAPSAIRASIWEAIWPMRRVLAFNGPHEAALVFRKRLTCGWLVPNLLLTGRTAEKLSYFVRRAFPPREFLLDKYGQDSPDLSYWNALTRRYASLFARKAEV